MKDYGVKKILELGCGQGRDGIFLASKGFEVTALDYSQAAIKSLLERVKQMNVSMDARVYGCTCL